jgi:arylsulfatase A-like enzyme
VRGVRRLALLLLAGAAFAIAYTTVWNPRASRRPNIILIVTDDQDPASTRYMPFLLDRIAARGVTFSYAFVASPLCVPSRASILRGQYFHSHGVMRPVDFVDSGFEQQTVATMLQGAGYRTALVGKYLGEGLGDEIPPGWDEWHSMLTHNVYYNYVMNDNGKRNWHGYAPGDYISTVLSKTALDFIEQTSRNQPFFLYIGTVAPHAPVTPPPGHEGAFADISEFPSIEEDVSDKPKWVREFRQANAGNLQLAVTDQGRQRAVAVHRNRLRTLQSVDEMVRDLTDALTDAGLAENTYFFYISDNSGGVSKHVPAGAKLSPYDDGIHVPFFASGPGVVAASPSALPVSAVDLLPTFAELAGVAAPSFSDGRSLVPLLKGGGTKPGEWRETIEAGLGRLASWVWVSYPPPYKLMRSAEFKYIEYETGEREYYDLMHDPGEMENIYPTLTTERQKELAVDLAEGGPEALWR